MRRLTQGPLDPLFLLLISDPHHGHGTENSPGADDILRASEWKDFHTHNSSCPSVRPRCLEHVFRSAAPNHRVLPTPNYRRQQSFGSARDFPSNYMHQKNTECSFPCDSIAHKFNGTIATSLEAVFEENPCIQVAKALGVVSSALYTFSPRHDECIYNAQNLRSRAEGLLGDFVKMAKTHPWENQ